MPRGPKGDARRAEFDRRVSELIATGRYNDYLGIESALSGEFAEARGWLDNEGLREDIRIACADAKKGRSDA